MRYRQLLQAVHELKPKSILEIGTWDGYRAMQMLHLSKGAKYFGFDLFEDADEKTDSEEKNVKPHHSFAEVKARLAPYDAQLFKGNTRETLKDFNEPVDFVWLDGGHSIETIRSDWENVKRVLSPGAAVFFDDYYTGIDVSEYGCNTLVQTLPHEVLPDRDPVVPEGWVQMVRVFHDVDPYLQTR
jgi:predicted O-methyltransferase YrrM